MMRFGSVCSGIEAASVAWAPLSWHATWFAEIEPFPAAVLTHHYPTTPNLGDMSTLPARILAGEVEAPDLLCGGTPCQAFSVAGLRQSLDDERGNLSLTFCEVADAIDAVRLAQGQDPAIIVWENVPGVLNTRDGAFGCILARLAGEDEAITVDRWPRAGLVDGRRRRVAWCVLDAQWFGVAQRRRRVYVVAVDRRVVERTGGRADPAAILSIGSCLRRDTPTRPRPGQGAAGGAAAGARGSGFRMTAFGKYADDDIASTIKMRDFKDATDLVANPALAVRRLTPIECERLQGFPDGYTAISWRGKPADQCPDNPRYKALGNSWAVPVVRWIGARIAASLEAEK